MASDWRVVQEVVNRDSANRHYNLRARLAQSNSQITWPNIDTICSSLIRTKFEGQQQIFFGRSASGRDLVSVVARVSPTICDLNQSAVGMLGFFDADDAPDIAAATLTRGSEWLCERGCMSIVGPIDGDTWHHYRLNVGPYNEPPFLLEPNDPHYYSGLWRNAGFEVLEKYFSKTVDRVESITPSTQRSYDAAMEAGYKLRPLAPNDFESELKVIFCLSREIFKENFLYDDISWDEFVSLYGSVKKLIEPRLVWFAIDKTGNPVGFLFCWIDVHTAMQSMRGQSGLLAKLRFLFNKRRAAAVNFKTLGVLPEHRRARVGTALMHRGYVESLKLGFHRANLCLIREGNYSARLDAGLGRIIRQYELYQTPGSHLKRD